MRTDHVIVIPDQQVHVPAQLLEYMARKANRLGLQGREISRVYTQTDSEGEHIYFETNSTTPVGTADGR